MTNSHLRLAIALFAYNALVNSGWSTLKPKLLHVAISAAAYAALMRALSLLNATASR